MGGIARNSAAWQGLVTAADAPFRHDLPEHRLLYAIISRAIIDASITKGTKWCPAIANVRDDAVGFLFSEATAKWSFLWMLQQLTDNPRATATQIRKVVTAERKSAGFS